jgi:hypothetical protein
VTRLPAGSDERWGDADEPAQAGAEPSAGGTETRAGGERVASSAYDRGPLLHGARHGSWRCVHRSSPGDDGRWDFGQTSQRWRSTEASARAAEQERAAAEQILLQVRTAFFDAVAYGDLLGVARETLATQRNHLAQIEEFARAGTRLRPHVRNLPQSRQPGLDLERGQRREETAGIETRGEPGSSFGSGRERLDHGLDVMVLEHIASALAGVPDGDTDHGPGQVVGPNHLAGKQQPERGVDAAQ